MLFHPLCPMTHRTKSPPLGASFVDTQGFPSFGWRPYCSLMGGPYSLQVKFLNYCSSINQAGAFSALFSSFQREMVCWRVIPQHGFISFSCWDVLARSSPLVYWLQTICDCRGLWLLSLQKQEMQSIHERHRTFFFSLLKNVYLFLPAFLGTMT